VISLDGVDYEIDLSAEHTDELHTAPGEYIDHACKVGGTRRVARGGRWSANAIDTHKVREWAREQSIEIKDRGRVPANIVEQYRPATGGSNKRVALATLIAVKPILANLAKRNIGQLTALVKTRLGRMQHRPGLIDGFLADSGLDLSPFVTLTIEDW
jgi:hypothetical protein